MLKFFRPSFVYLALACAPHAAADLTNPEDPGHAPAGYTLAWEDRFDGKDLDTEHWFYRDGVDRGRTVMAQENAMVEHGELNLVCQVGNFRIDPDTYPRADASKTYHYKGIGVISRWRFGKGYYEARSRMLSGDLWHPAFWLETANPEPGTNHLLTFHNRTEIDIMETEPQLSSTQSIRVHDWLTRGEHRRLPDVKTVGWTPSSDQALGWFTWGMDLTREQAVFYEDGREVVAVDMPDDFLRSPMNIILSCVTIKEPTHGGIQKFSFVRFYESDALRAAERKECEDLIQRTSIVGEDFLDRRDSDAEYNWIQDARNAKAGDTVTYRVYITDPGRYHLTFGGENDDHARGEWRLDINGENQGGPIGPQRVAEGPVDLGIKSFERPGYHDFTFTLADDHGHPCGFGFDYLELKPAAR